MYRKRKLFQILSIKLGIIYYKEKVIFNIYFWNFILSLIKIQHSVMYTTKGLLLNKNFILNNIL